MKINETTIGVNGVARLPLLRSQPGKLLHPRYGTARRLSGARPGLSERVDPRHDPDTNSQRPIEPLERRSIYNRPGRACLLAGNAPRIAPGSMLIHRFPRYRGRDLVFTRSPRPSRSV